MGPSETISIVKSNVYINRRNNIISSSSGNHHHHHNCKNNSSRNDDYDYNNSLIFEIETNAQNLASAAAVAASSNGNNIHDDNDDSKNTNTNSRDTSSTSSSSSSYLPAMQRLHAVTFHELADFLQRLMSFHSSSSSSSSSERCCQCKVRIAKQKINHHQKNYQQQHYQHDISTPCKFQIDLKRRHYMSNQSMIQLRLEQGEGEGEERKQLPNCPSCRLLTVGRNVKRQTDLVNVVYNDSVRSSWLSSSSSSSTFIDAAANDDSCTSNFVTQAEALDVILSAARPQHVVFLNLFDEHVCKYLLKAATDDEDETTTTTTTKTIDTSSTAKKTTIPTTKIATTITSTPPLNKNDNNLCGVVWNKIKNDRNDTNNTDIAFGNNNNNYCSSNIHAIKFIRKLAFGRTAQRQITCSTMPWISQLLSSPYTHLEELDFSECWFAMKVVHQNNNNNNNNYRGTMSQDEEEEEDDEEGNNENEGENLAVVASSSAFYIYNRTANIRCESRRATLRVLTRQLATGLANNNTSLKILNLEDCCLDDLSLATILHVDGCSNLQKLNISKNYCAGRTLTAISNLLIKYNQLECLDLSKQFHDVSSAANATTTTNNNTRSSNEMRNNNRNIGTLDLSPLATAFGGHNSEHTNDDDDDDDDDDDGNNNKINPNTSLQILNLSNNYNLVGLDRFLDALVLAQNKTLHTIHIDLVPDRRPVNTKNNNNNIHNNNNNNNNRTNNATTTAFVRPNLGDTNYQALGRFLHDTKSLKILNMPGHTMSQESFIGGLINNIQVNTSLETLNLDRLNVLPQKEKEKERSNEHDNGKKEQQQQQQQHYQSSLMHPFGSMLTINSTLRSLSLKSCGFNSSIDLTILAQYLPQMTGIQHLDLRMNRFQTLEPISVAISKNVSLFQFQTTAYYRRIGGRNGTKIAENQNLTRENATIHYYLDLNKGGRYFLFHVLNDNTQNENNRSLSPSPSLALLANVLEHASCDAIYWTIRQGGIL